MSYFDMINFNEDALLEGKQAEEYKACKAAEKYDKMTNNKKYDSNRGDYKAGYKSSSYTTSGNRIKHPENYNGDIIYKKDEETN